jgi:hypothetical protein
MLTDRFDLPVTCAAAAVDDYVAAVDLLLSAWPGADALLDRALAADPDFALAHIARARLLQLQARMAEAQAAAADARSRADRVTARERATSRRSDCRSTALPARRWRWSAPMSRNIRATRSRCR